MKKVVTILASLAVPIRASNARVETLATALTPQLNALKNAGILSEFNIFKSIHTAIFIAPASKRTAALAALRGIAELKPGTVNIAPELKLIAPVKGRVGPPVKLHQARPAQPVDPYLGPAKNSPEGRARGPLYTPGNI